MCVCAYEQSGQRDDKVFHTKKGWSPKMNSIRLAHFEQPQPERCAVIEEYMAPSLQIGFYWLFTFVSKCFLICFCFCTIYPREVLQHRRRNCFLFLWLGTKSSTWRLLRGVLLVVHFRNSLVLQSYPFRLRVLNGTRMFQHPTQNHFCIWEAFLRGSSSNQNPIPFRGKFKTHGIFFGVFGVT